MVTDMATDTDMQTKFPTKHPVSGFLLCCLTVSTFAQQGIPGAATAGGVLGNPSTSAQASSVGRSATNDQLSTDGRTWVITPRVSLTETLTDNSNINRSANNKESELITQIAPGIRVEARTVRLKAFFDYSLRGQFYAKEPDYNRSQNSLNTFGTLEAVDNWLFLDFSGIIAQQTISAFGTQSTSNTTINNNSTETATYRLSPYIRGQLGGLAEYSIRYNVSTTRSEATTVSDIDVSQWIGQLRGSTPFKNLRWTLDGNQQTTDYSRGRKTDAELLRAMLTYSVSPQFRLTVSGGQESNNYASLEQETNTTHGYGFDWNPTERTKFSAFKEKRFFGDGHNVNFNHRFPMSSIQFSDTRDVTVLPNQFSTVGLGSVYDLYFEQFTNLIPDPVQRANYVNALLAQSGIDPNAQVTSGFTTSRATIRRNQRLALSVFGARNSITFLANRSESQGVLASQSTNDALSQSNIINQQGFGLNLSHRLSEISNLNFLGSRQESTGSGANTLKTTTTLYQVNLTTKFGAKTTGSLSARRSEFDSNTNPYTENALIGTVSFIY
jgi:uncharacterized protein (PEP-CTERM system associated)